MKLSNLTSENLIVLDAVYEDRIAAIRALTDKIDAEGKLSNKEQFLDAVMLREEEGPTCLGEYLAVPHGKSVAVTEPVFACAFVKNELMWKGIDGDEPVNMIFLLAIPPAEAGSTHMEVLTTLTSSLVEDEFRDALLAAKSQQEVMALFGAEGDTNAEQQPLNGEDVADDQMAEDISDKAYPLVLGVGIAVAALLFMLL